MTDKHTPGPWRDDVGGEIRAEGNGRAFPLVARVVFQGIKTSPNWSANARLIAAAPELLSALEAIRHMATTDPTNLPQKMFAGDIAARATAAIEAAKGDA